jgi:hypothetical protein
MTARLMGVSLVLLAVLVFATAVLTALLGLSAAVLVGVAALGLLVLGTAFWLLRRVPVVRLDDEGYRVRLVRGVGVATASWTDVEELATSYVMGTPCVVLRLGGGRRSTIPMTAVAVDREQFVRDLQGHLQRGHGLRPV